MPSAREIARARFTAALLDAARARLATDGAAGLSLRAVARDLGVASSAVYRYVDSRDALLTLLVVEAYDEVGAACEAAAERARADGATPGGVLLAVARAFRTWATEHPHAYALVYGTPVPGYAAPEGTVEHALRVWAVLVGVVQDAAARGELAPPDPARLAGVVTERARDLGRRVAAARGLPDDPPADADVVRTITLFTGLLGAVAAELFGHLRGAVADPAAAFDAVVVAVAAGAGLRVDPA